MTNNRTARDLSSYVQMRWDKVSRKHGLEAGTVDVDRLDTPQGEVFVARIVVDGAGFEAEDVDRNAMHAVRGVFAALHAACAASSV